MNTIEPTTAPAIMPIKQKQNKTKQNKTKTKQNKKQKKEYLNSK